MLRILILFQFLAIALILAYHFYSLSHVPPINDGSNCTARASNLGLLLQHGELKRWVSELSHEKNNLLSVAYFSLWSLIVGPGRLAFGFGWAAALLAFILLNRRWTRDDSKPHAHHFAIVLFLACTPILSRMAGLLAQRYDALAVLLLATALSALFARRFLPAAWLLLIAVLAKGPALPVAGICLAVYFLLHPDALRPLLRDFLQKKAAWILLMLVAGAYLAWSFTEVAGYNLMAVKSGKSALAQFLEAYRADSRFYWREIYRFVPHAVFLFAGGALLFLFTFRQTPSRLLVAGPLLLVLTLVLFTSHPVHSGVLVVWMIPGFWWVCLGVGRWMAGLGRGRLPLLLAVVIIGSLGIARMNTEFPLRIPKVKDPPFHALPLAREQTWAGLRDFSLELAKALAAEKTPFHDTRLLVNFLYFPDYYLHVNYDALRVLLFERLGRSAPYLSGWELATRGPDWRSELRSFAGAREHLLFVLVIDGQPSFHHLGLTTQLAAQVPLVLKGIPSVRPLPIVQEPIPHFGRMQAFLLDTNQSRSLLSF